MTRYEDEQWRRGLGTRAQRERHLGRREEVLPSVRGADSDPSPLRDEGRFLDTSVYSLIGFGTISTMKT
jgi:hypothetical protein